MDINFSRELPPGQGQNVPYHLNTDTGAGELAASKGAVWASVGRLGQTLGEFGNAKLDQLQAQHNELELSGLRGQADTLMHTASLEAEKASDPATIEPLYQKAASDISMLHSSNPKVEAAWQSHLNETLPQWQNHFAVAALHKTQQNLDADFATQSQSDLVSGSRDAFVQRADKMLEFGRITKGQRDEMVNGFPAASALAQANQEIMTPGATAGQLADAGQRLAGLDAKAMSPQQRDVWEKLSERQRHLYDEAQNENYKGLYDGVYKADAAATTQEHYAASDAMQGQIAAALDKRDINDHQAVELQHARMASDKGWETRNKAIHDPIVQGEAMDRIFGMDAATTPEQYKATRDWMLTNAGALGEKYPEMIKQLDEQYKKKSSQAGVLKSAITVAEGMDPLPERAPFMARELATYKDSELSAGDLHKVVAEDAAAWRLSHAKKAEGVVEKSEKTPLTAHEKDVALGILERGYQQSGLTGAVLTFDEISKATKKTQGQVAIDTMLGYGASAMSDPDVRALLQQKYPEDLAKWDKAQEKIRLEAKWNAMPPVRSGLPQIKNDADYDKLPAGDYLDPNGVRRTKK